MHSHKFKNHAITRYSHVPSDQVIPYKEGHYKACIDINYFYAQVEERDRMLEGFPIIVGGYRNRKNIGQGIVATSNYVARSFGIKTGMSAFEAQKIYPHVLMFQVDYLKYEAISNEMLEVYKLYSPEIEPFSIDEVFLDLTGIIRNEEDAEEWIRRIKNHIWAKVGLTVNVGISTTKSYAKILVDLNKPNGHTIALERNKIEKLLYPLPVDSIMGIGRKRGAKLREKGIETISDLANSRKQLIQKIFGKNIGENFWMQSRGEADAIIDPLGKKQQLKYSATHMHTFPHATLNRFELWGECMRGLEQICYRLRAHNRKAHVYTLLFRPQEINLRKRSMGLGRSMKVTHTNQETEITEQFKSLYWDLYNLASKKVIMIRGIGVFASDLRDVNTSQIDMFETDGMRNVQLYEAIDEIRDRGKFNIIQFGASKSSVKGKTHFLERCE